MNSLTRYDIGGRKRMRKEIGRGEEEEQKEVRKTSIGVRKRMWKVIRRSKEEGRTMLGVRMILKGNMKSNIKI